MIDKEYLVKLTPIAELIARPACAASMLSARSTEMSAVRNMTQCPVISSRVDSHLWSDVISSNVVTSSKCDVIVHASHELNHKVLSAILHFIYLKGKLV